jgi:CheY-like chemotaxis protein
MGMLQLLETTDLTDEQAEYVRTGLNSGNSLLRVISDILDLSRIEAGKVEIRREEFNLARTLDVVLETFREEVRRKGISLYYEFSLAAAADYVGDETRLRQVLFNLVGNAVKFTKDGDIKIEVWPLENDGGEHLLFSVSDTGVGVPKDKLKNVFEPFSQADGSYTRKYQGSGLGLTIVNRLVSLMGGNVSMESEPGLGTTVHFTIAVSRAEKDAKPAREPVESIDLTGLRVVVAEDNDVNRMAAVRMLQTAGCEVIEAVDGSEVLAILAKEKADLVLMDVQMPKMDGVIATRNIRSGAGGMYDPNIPIVAMTAHAMAGDREKFLEAGMNDYIAKPVNMRDLTETISKYMDG